MRLRRFALAGLLGVEILACAPESSVSRVVPAGPTPVGPDAAILATDSSTPGAGADEVEGAQVDAGATRRDDAGSADMTALDRPGQPIEAGPGPVVDAGDAVSNADVDAAVDAPPECQPGTCKRVFLSSRAMPNGGFGSLGAADALCTILAVTANLGGNWRAWLSTAIGSPANRFSRAGVPHVLVDGTRVAASWAALTSGTLEHAIDMFETGSSIPAGQMRAVWTGTTPAGLVTSATCGNWTNNSPGLPSGHVGVSNRRDVGWTQAQIQTCERTGHLYCFEQ